jgi:hypothetical protein
MNRCLSELTIKSLFRLQASIVCPPALVCISTWSSIRYVMPSDSSESRRSARFADRFLAFNPHPGSDNDASTSSMPPHSPPSAVQEIPHEIWQDVLSYAVGPLSPRLPPGASRAEKRDVNRARLNVVLVSRTFKVRLLFLCCLIVW